MAKFKGEAAATANIKKNRLFITLKGIIPKKEAEHLYTDIRFCVSDLQPGFTVITDLTLCRIGHLEAIGAARKIAQFLLEKKVGRIVRIVGPAKVIYLQMLKLSDKARGYEPIYVATLEEAEALLDELAQKESAEEDTPDNTDSQDNTEFHANPKRSAGSA